MNYLETHCTDPFYNLAAEEYVLSRRTKGDWLMLWQNSSAVVVGLNQNTEEEIDRGYVERSNISVVRRMTGGGAVYHDLGNLNYSFITDAGDASMHSIAQLTQPICRALRELGADAELSGRNDILVSGKKVSGTAERIMNGRLLHHGCLLFDADLDVLSKALRPDPEKFSSKAVKSVSGRVANIRPQLAQDMGMNEFRAFLRQSLLGDGATEAKLSDAEVREIKALADSKYRSWDWNYGRAASYGFKSRKRFPGGTLEIRLDVRDGVIAEAVFTGDYMARSSNEALLAAMKGLRFQREAVDALLDGFTLDELFGGISREQILETMFG